MFCCFCIEESKAGIVEQLGEYHCIAYPGFHWRVPGLQRLVHTADLRVRPLTVKVSTCTADAVWVVCELTLQYKVSTDGEDWHSSTPSMPNQRHPPGASTQAELLPGMVEDDSAPLRRNDSEQPKCLDDPLQQPPQLHMCPYPPDGIVHSYYSAEDPIDLLRTWTTQVMWRLVPLHTLDELYDQHHLLATQASTAIRALALPYGWAIPALHIIDIQPDRELIDSMNAILIARCNLQTARTVADTAKHTVVLVAEAVARAKRVVGEGVAKERLEIVRSFHHGFRLMDESRQGLAFVKMATYFDRLAELAHGSPHGLLLAHGPHTPSVSRRQIRKALAEMT
eukprot:NODE_2529_length_1154_cov_8.894839_g2410_i0.p1 GENE.NODE_2529_length_1154_cov_8.894839_g2410_i0~~NODE_2529_length_1154_cov_8.894839_g2410_i0.p1  ORF type:complete len:339 (+),score=87.94 NODE_2529_length_1154_cov_8.894839_g2410_i0:51-1067(+)